jgi:hypothetical protein
MRTAEKIVNEFFGENGIMGLAKQRAITAINEARKEALEEAADKARTRTNDESTSIIVDKQSILNLINELK